MTKKNPRMKTNNSKHQIQTSASKLSFLQLILSTHCLWQQHKVPQIHTTHFHTVGQRRTETREEKRVTILYPFPLGVRAWLTSQHLNHHCHRLTSNSTIHHSDGFIALVCC